jgi:hypothetical protein
MRIVDIRERTVPISRYADPSLPSGGLDTSIVSVITDATRDGRPVVGYGFASIGRFAQGGLIRERFVPRLLAARDTDVTDEAGTNLDPFRAWNVMMTGEKLRRRRGIPILYYLLYIRQLPEGAAALGPATHLGRYYDRHAARPSFERTTPPAGPPRRVPPN